MGDLIWGWVTAMLDASLGDSQMASVLKLLTFKGEFDYSVFWEIVNNLLVIVKPVGFALITTYFLMHMFDAASKEQITIDSIIKTLIQLVLAVGVIGNIDLIVNAFLSIGESMFTSMTGWNDTPTLNGADIVDIWKANEPSGYWGALLDALWIWVIHQIAIIAIDFAAISRILEIAWRIVFAPIGCANVFEGGVSSPGIKYLKSLFAVILSAIALYGVAAAGFALCASFLTSGGEAINAGTGAVTELKSSLLFAMASLLATAGASIGVSNKIKEVVA